jgi:hypothetical protein
VSKLHDEHEELLTYLFSNGSSLGRSGLLRHRGSLLRGNGLSNEDRTGRVSFHSKGGRLMDPKRGRRRTAALAGAAGLAGLDLEPPGVCRGESTKGGSQRKDAGGDARKEGKSAEDSLP